MNASEAWNKYKADKLDVKKQETKEFIDSMMIDILEILEDAFKAGYDIGHSDGYNSTSIDQEEKHG
jgi:hypothetical protein